MIALYPRRSPYVVQSGTFVVHVILTAVMAWWAFLLAVPVPTFTASAGLGEFAKIWPYTENGWAAVFAVSAIFGIAGLFQKNRNLRLASLVFLAVGHIMVALVFTTADLTSRVLTPPPGLYSILAGAALWRVAAERWLRA